MLTASIVAGIVAVGAVLPADRSTVDDIATYRPGGFEWQALGGGTLVSHGGCVYFAGVGGPEGASELTLPVFPDPGTTWDGTTLSMGGAEYHLGDRVLVGGGEVSGPLEPGFRKSLPDRCTTDRVWMATVIPAEERQAVLDRLAEIEGR